MKFKALSVRQPWASLIAAGRKTIEVRSHATAYRGELLICSGVFMPHADRLGHPDQQLPRGQALCIVRLVDCRPFAPVGHAAADLAGACIDEVPAAIAFAWVLAGVRPLARTFAVKGQQRFFEVALPAEMMPPG